MVLTITMVGNGQNGGTAPGTTINGNVGPTSYTVLSQNDLAQLMSGQTVTGLLNPDGSITLNSGMMPAQQMTSMPSTAQCSIQPSITTTSCANYVDFKPEIQTDHMLTSPTSSISTLQSVNGHSDTTIPMDNYNTHQHRTSSQISCPTIQKKTGQKRLTARQKLAQQQQQQPEQQHQHQEQQHQSDTTNNCLSQQPQIVATVQLPNGQIGQLIAPSGGHFWSPNAINLQQLSMAVAAATGTMPQPLQQQSIQNPPQQGLQGIPASHTGLMVPQNGQFINQNPEDPSKWQIVQPSQVNTQESGLHNGGTSNINDVDKNNSSDQALPCSSETQPQKKLKRLACTCPNCRDGDNNRGTGDRKKQHICHFQDCNKVYGKTSHLRAHLRWHSGERPYVCNWSFCGKKFTRSDELQRHRRTHTGEKRFQCTECLKRFMRSDHLSKHLKTHLSSKKAGS